MSRSFLSSALLFNFPIPSPSFSHLLFYRFKGVSHKKDPCIHDLSKQKEVKTVSCIPITLCMFFTNLSQLTTPSKDTPGASSSLLELFNIFVGNAHFALHSSFTAL